MEFSLFLDLPSSILTASLTDLGTQSQAAVSGWPQIWHPVAEPLGNYRGLHSFRTTPYSTTPYSTDPGVPQGHGFGAFTVHETTGALTIGGKLADGSALATTTFVGPAGQILIYQSLYGGKSTYTGIVTLTKNATRNNNTLTGAATWSKPAAPTDLLYPAGFQTTDCLIAGGALPALPSGGVIMGLPNNTPENARLEFTGSVPAPEAAEFDIPAAIYNPAATGLTNKATLPTFLSGGNPNKTALSKITGATGAFGGDFTLPGATPALARKATYEGQIVHIGGVYLGYGYYLLSELPTVPGQTLATTPKHAGRVLLRPAQPP
eukprot:gene43531-53222_t